MNRQQRTIRTLAHIIGRLGLHLRAKWIPPLGGFLLTILMVGAVDYLFTHLPFPLFTDLNKSWHHNFGDWLNIWMILAIYTITGLLIWSIQARSRMVVEKFVNYVGKDFEDAANGASMLLLTKLGQLHALYQAVDEQRAIPTATLNQSIPLEHYTAIDAAINVDTIEAFLKDAVSTQSTLNIGPLQIPIGTLFSLIGHVAQGPRIIASFHKDRRHDGKNLLILSAQATRNGQSFPWRVERELTSDQPLSVDLSNLLDEFACRIFTDMTLRSTVRWRAAALFADGLRAYRECLRTPKNRISNLQLAEEKFVETLTEDTQYTLAHYNLGVVLTELQRKEAATTAFERAIREDPRSYQAYYALALNCYQDKQYYRTTQLCKRIIELKTDSASMAKAYQLKAMAQIELNKRTDAIRNCTSAIRHARRALRRAEITQQDEGSGSNNKILKAETLLGVCISTLAKIYQPALLDVNKSLPCQVPSASNKQKLHKAKRLLHAALKLDYTDTSYDALYHWECGRICFAEGLAIPESHTKRKLALYKEAAQHCRIAVRVAPNCIEYLADLIFNQAHSLAASIDYDAEEITPDLDYEEFLFQTLLDLITSTVKKEQNLEVVLETVCQAYAVFNKTNPPIGPSHANKTKAKVECLNKVKASYQTKLACINRIQDYLPENLAHKTVDELKRMRKSVGNTWEYGQILLTLARYYDNAGRQESPTENQL